jgi:hypothetical protein
MINVIKLYIKNYTFEHFKEFEKVRFPNNKQFCLLINFTRQKRSILDNNKHFQATPENLVIKGKLINKFFFISMVSTCMPEPDFVSIARNPIKSRRNLHYSSDNNDRAMCPTGLLMRSDN